MKTKTIKFIFNRLNDARMHCEGEGNSEGTQQLREYLEDFCKSMGEVFILTEIARLRLEAQLKEYFALSPGLLQVDFINDRRELLKTEDPLSEVALIATVLLTILSPISE